MQSALDFRRAQCTCFQSLTRPTIIDHSFATATNARGAFNFGLLRSYYMKRMMTLALVCLLLGNAPLPVATAQQAQLAYKLNPQIEKIVGDISPANIEATVRKLVSFGTGHTF